MKDNIGDDVRRRMAAFLPEALDVAVKSYNLFCDRNLKDSGKDDFFSKSHMACKAAMAHVEMLVKLSRQVSVTKTESGMSVDEVEKLLEAAQAEYDAYANTCRGDEEEMA